MENLDKEKIRQALNALKEKFADIDAQEKQIDPKDYGKTATGVEAYVAAQKRESERIKNIRNQFIANLEYPDTREEVIAILKFLWSMIKIVQSKESDFRLLMMRSIKYTVSRIKPKVSIDIDTSALFSCSMTILVKAQKEYADVDNAMRLALINIVEENNIDDIRPNYIDHAGVTEDLMHGYVNYSLYRKEDHGYQRKRWKRLKQKFAKFDVKFKNRTAWI